MDVGTLSNHVNPCILFLFFFSESYHNCRTNHNMKSFVLWKIKTSESKKLENRGRNIEFNLRKPKPFYMGVWFRLGVAIRIDRSCSCSVNVRIVSTFVNPNLTHLSFVLDRSTRI